MRVSRTGTEELAPTAEVTVTVTKADGTTVSRTTTVGFYERTARPGDFVYADGSYSDIYDEGRTVVAVCCYIDPENPALRLGVAPRSIGSGVWGYSSGDPALTLSETTQNLVPYNVYDIPDLNTGQNCTFASNSDTAIRDETSAGDAYGFKRYPTSDFHSRIGFAVTDKALGAYSEGSLLPVGMAETLKIIAHRNKILRDANVNLIVPVATTQESEITNLTNLIAQAKATNASLARLYFPAASYAYAYEPSVKKDETLSEKFFSHRWFLPAPGDALRLSWFCRQHSVEGSTFDIFAKSMNLNLITDVPNSFHCTGEDTNHCHALIATKTNGIEVGQFNQYTRTWNYHIYPMVQF